MKKILLSLMAMFALTASAAIDLNDPTTYTAKVYDFVKDAALNGQTLSIGTTNLGTAYETGNAKQQVIYNCTAPSPLVGVFAFQGVSTSRGTYLRKDYGLYNINATRSAAILNLKAGQIAVFVSSAETDFTGGGTNEGKYTVSKSDDKLTATVTMTNDGNLGFCIAKNQYLKKVTIYTEKVAGTCTAPEATVTGTAGTGRVITLTDADEGAKIYWSESENGTYTEYTAPFTTDAATIYAYADNGAKSDVISFETGAGTLVKLNGVTVTRTGDNSYTVSSSQVGVVGNPTATIYYTVDGGDDQTAQNGATITADGYITAWAVVDGYTNSDTTEVEFVEPYDKGEMAYTADFISLGGENAGYNPSSAETEDIQGVDGTYYYSTLNDIYLEVVQDASGNYTWLYRTGKGNSNFKCQYASAKMVFKDIKAGTVFDIYAGNDNSAKAPITNVVNGELGYSYNGHYFVKATADGNVAVTFSMGSMIMSVTEYAPVATVISNVATAAAKDGKFLENGKVVILKNNVKYNTIGQQIK